MTDNTEQELSNETFISKYETENFPEDLLIAKKYQHLWKSAQRRGKEFSLTLSDVRSLVRRKTCFYTGVKFGEGDLIKSIDRIDSSIGYVKGNVVACTRRINNIKEHLLESDSHISMKFDEIKMFVEVLTKLGFKN